uniref:Uncharacterized protein n=1 Tax=Sphaerodactylus townsendi TaxID=933632 RepID=A0ACB8EGB9_9SAUR
MSSSLPPKFTSRIIKTNDLPKASGVETPQRSDRRFSELSVNILRLPLCEAVSASEKITSDYSRYLETNVRLDSFQCEEIPVNSATSDNRALTIPINGSSPPSSFNFWGRENLPNSSI